MRTFDSDHAPPEVRRDHQPALSLKRNSRTFPSLATPDTLEGEHRPAPITKEWVVRALTGDSESGRKGSLFNNADMYRGVVAARATGPKHGATLVEAGAATSKPGLAYNFGQVKVLGTSPAVVQTKLTIGRPGDRYEQEADRVADQVMQMPEPRLQRVESPAEEDEDKIATKPVADQVAPLVRRQGPDVDEALDTTLMRQKEKEDNDARAVRRKQVSFRVGTSEPVMQRAPGSSGPDPIDKAMEVLKTSPRIANPKTALDKQLANAANLLSGEMILGVFSEEKERTGPLRQLGEALEMGTETYGRGALGYPAYKDVETSFPKEKIAYESIFGTAPSDWIDALKDKNWVVFYSAAYLLLSMAKREKTGRSQTDQMKLGIALYHGGRMTVVAAQTAAAKSLGKKEEDLTWSEIEVELKKLAKGPDIIDYVDGVVTHKFQTMKKEFTFDVKAQLIGKTDFMVGEYGTIKVTAEGDYDGDLTSLPPEKQPPPNYWIVIGGEKVLYKTGKKLTYTWNNLRPGAHFLRIYNRYLNGTIPLKGKGTVEVRS